jgi:thiol reductant ABC exporter CydD subunit
VTAGRLLALDQGARRCSLLAVLAGVGAALALIGQLGALAMAVAGVFLGGRVLAEVVPWLLVGGVLLVVRALLSMVREVAARCAAERMVGTLRAGLTARLVSLGPTWLAGERSGELAAALGGGLEAIEEYVGIYLPVRWLAMIVPLIVLVVVLLLDPPSALVLLVTGPLLLLLLMVIGGRTRAVTEARFLEMRSLSAFFLDILRGLPTLRMFGRSREQVENLRRISSRYGDATMDVLRTAFQTSLVLEWGSTIAIALVAVEIGLRLLYDGIDFERALAVLLITPECFLPLRLLAVRFHVGAAGKAATERAFAILEPAQAIEGSATGGEVVAGAHVGAGASVSQVSSDPGATVGLVADAAAPPEVRFEGVTVTYPGRELAALSAVTFELPAGERLALVGASGAGKSTTAAVLLRFVEPQAGRVSLAGLPAAGIGLAEWRAMLAWVPQRPHLFSGSIADNIRMSRPDADDEALREAARAANALDFIERLPGGFEAPVGEAGARLSGGQRQRLAIARAFLREAPLVVLDEATSYQDEASERAVMEALDRLSVGRTVLLIAHHLWLAERSDRVVVLDDGRVAETGTPAELLARGGPYRQLLEDQAAGRGWAA